VAVAVFDLVPRSSAVERNRLLLALGLLDDGSATAELGRPETGATALLVDDGSASRVRLRLHVPLLRSPTSALDLLPTAMAAAASLDAAWIHPARPDLDALAAWMDLHREACRAAHSASVVGGMTEVLPHLPRADLDALHGWLLAIARTDRALAPVVALVDDDGNAFPSLYLESPPAPGDLAAPLAFAIADGRVWPITDLGNTRADGFVEVERALASPGEPIGQRRVVSAVEIVDDESLI
jgi:hypothetical protein